MHALYTSIFNVDFKESTKAAIAAIKNDFANRHSSGRRRHGETAAVLKRCFMTLDVVSKASDTVTARRVQYSIRTSEIALLERR